MATLGATFIDLIDLAKRQDNDEIAAIIELLMEMNGILDDAIAIPANNGTKHKHTIRTGLPSVAWGKFYQGIVQSKSLTAQVEDVTGFVEALSTIDMRLLDISGNEGALRLSEAVAFIEAMNQEVVTKIFYGDQSTAPEEFTGLAPRFDSLTGAANSNQIVDGGGSGSDNTSVWMVTWGDMMNCLIYPKNLQAGLQRTDKGEQRVLDGSSNPYYVKEELFRWDIGLAVKDWRFVSRIANIDVSDLQAGSTDLYSLFVSMYYRHHGRRKGKQGLSDPSNTAMGRTAIYCNTGILEALDLQASNRLTADNFVRLVPANVEGKEVQTWRGIPLRETDGIVNTEAAVA